MLYRSDQEGINTQSLYSSVTELICKGGESCAGSTTTQQAGTGKRKATVVIDR